METAGRVLKLEYVLEDRRIDLAIRELSRYRVTVGALQETKWFGNAVYKVGESIVLAVDRSDREARV